MHRTDFPQSAMARRSRQKRAIRIFGEYYRGNLPFGQFYKLRAEYYGVGINVSF